MERDQHPVLITGCSSGIGRTAARILRERGYPVIPTARRAEDVERLRAEGLESIQLDLDEPASVENGFEQAMALTGGRLYALFNNGAWGLPGAVEDLSREALLAQLQTNLLGWHQLTCLAIPVMRAAGKGRIIQNSSVLGLVAMPYRGAYNCSKFALEGLTDTLRLELYGTGIFVSLIEPGPIRSRFRQNAHARFLQYIDREHSAHRQAYVAMERRLAKEGDAAPFTLPPEAVVRKLIHALESPRPRARYGVTVPTRLFAALRRLLPTAALDAVLRRASGGGAR
ncbi:MAG: SDR family NAD(P)-dependent oxidoreductase [Gammaproteobacteria bacterium]|nr:MAG: SDR family NAD(P)-dependent oxidoreductase [Gammaproteobacteria bacterium]